MAISSHNSSDDISSNGENWAKTDAMSESHRPPSSAADISCAHDAEEEDLRFRRLTRCGLGACAFWFVVLLLIYDGDFGLVYALLSLVSLTVVYLLASICSILMHTTRPFGLRSSETEYEMTDTTALASRNTINNDGDEFDEELQGTSITSYRFEETPGRVQACQEAVLPGRAPKNGTYKVVYVAVVFGRQLRSEGTLHLQFTISKCKNGTKSKQSSSPPLAAPSINNGWTISGKSTFGTISTTIGGGFVNADGQMYWIVPCRNLFETNQSSDPSDAVLYRGIFNLESCTLDNGDFQSIISQNGSTNETSSPTIMPPAVDKKHEGRIVRMEFVGVQDDTTSTMY
jgi:hypothetical protein